eukprot:394869-Prorocentrum_minimum.AAC.2
MQGEYLILSVQVLGTRHVSKPVLAGAEPTFDETILVDLQKVLTHSHLPPHEQKLTRNPRHPSQHCHSNNTLALPFCEQTNQPHMVPSHRWSTSYNHTSSIPRMMLSRRPPREQVAGGGHSPPPLRTPIP